MINVCSNQFEIFEESLICGSGPVQGQHILHISVSKLVLHRLPNTT